MIKESGRVVAVETDSLWVETIQRSTCNSCAAEKGCGQSLLAKWGNQKAYLRVLLKGRDPQQFQIDDRVELGIPEDVIVSGSLFVYLTPLILMILSAWVGQTWWGSDLAAMLAGVLGLALGGLLVRWQAYRQRDDERLQPVLLDIGRPFDKPEVVNLLDGVDKTS